MRPKIVALLLSGALLAGAQGAAATAGGATVVWQNPKLTVARGSQPLTITFKNRITRPIRFRCRFLLDSDWSTAYGRLRPLEKSRTQPVSGTTASQFSCRTRLAG